MRASAEISEPLAVTPLGLWGPWVEAYLRVPPGYLQRFHGVEMGHPRDYLWRRGALFYTAAGVRRAAGLVGVDLRVKEQEVRP